MEHLTIIKDLLISIAAISTTTIAYIGLKSWHKELKGRANFTVARELIKVTYKLRDAIASCRAPFVGATEFPVEYNPFQHNKDKETERKTWAHIFKNRWTPVLNVLEDFDTSALEAEALWGSNIRDLADKLRSSVRDLNLNIGFYIENVYSKGEEFRSDPDYGKKVKSIVFSSTSDKEDKFSIELRKAIMNIEEYIRPHLHK